MKTLDGNNLRNYTSIIIIVFLVLALILYSLKIFLVLFAGCLFAILLCSIANFIQSHVPLQYKGSLMLGIALLLIIFGLFLTYLFPKISAQLAGLQSNLPQILDQIRINAESYLGPEINVRHWLDQNARVIQDITQSTLKGATAAISALGTFTMVLFLGLFLAFDPDLYRKGFLSLIAPESRGKADKLAKKVIHDLQWWLVGRLISMSFVGVTTAIGLWYLDVPLAASLGFLTGLFDFIPFIGPVLAAIPAVLLSLTQAPQSTIYVVLLYGAVQLVEGYVVTPLIQKKAVSLSPALTIFAILLLGFYGGLLGTALAAPMTVALLVIIREAYVKSILERNMIVE